MAQETKKCEICGRELPVSDFSKSYKNRCRECVARLTREKRNNKQSKRSIFDDYLDSIPNPDREVITITIERGKGVYVDYQRDNEPKKNWVLITYKEVKCPECDGTGEVEAEYRADYDDEDYEIVGSCPICDGSGKIDEEVRTPTGKKIPQEDSIIKLGKGYFKWHHFRTIIKTCKMLDIKQIRLVRTHETEMSILELSKDIHIGFMPMYVDNEEGLKIKKRAISVKGIKA